MDVKFIANFELIDIGKKLCAWKSTVSCENTVGTLPSDRKEGTEKVDSTAYV